MPLFDTTTILRFANQGESYFASEFPCIIDRYCISVLDGISDYLLPDYITDIRRITYKGRRVCPLSHRHFMESTVSIASVGRPESYIYNNVGQNTISFYPTPNEDVIAVQTNLFTTEIPDRVIVEFYRVPDHLNFTIPLFFRRRLLKAYALKMCFQMEGKGQNLKAAAYWNEKWENLMGLYSSLLDELVNSPRRLIAASSYNYDFTPNQPHLPISRFGIGVRTGE